MEVVTEPVNDGERGPGDEVAGKAELPGATAHEPARVSEIGDGVGVAAAGDLDAAHVRPRSSHVDFSRRRFKGDRPGAEATHGVPLAPRERG